MSQSLTLSGRPPDLGMMAAVTIEMVEGRVGARSDPGSEEHMDLDASKSARHVSSTMTKNAGEISTGAIADSARSLPSLEVPVKLSFRDTVRGLVGSLPQDNIISDMDVNLHENDVIIGQQGTIPEIWLSNRVHKEIDDKLLEPSRVEKLLHQVAPASGGIMATVQQEVVIHAAVVIPQSNIVVVSNLETNEGSNMVVARDKVVPAPTTLQADKHIAV
ncbi:hypothetical protein V6N11_043246 [Hibiscus sabdariffa]|uniref:Uncharacterized protein n=1 Tax=Hibiscus sabdariffa TaxID=183260 RepID=A0ABR2QZB1_9ROSI